MANEKTMIIIELTALEGREHSHYYETGKVTIDGHACNVDFVYDNNHQGIIVKTYGKDRMMFELVNKNLAIDHLSEGESILIKELV